MNTKIRTGDKTLIDAVYKNVKMGADAMIDILDKSSEKTFRETLTAEIEAYEKLAKETGKKINEAGGTPKEENFMAKAAAKMGMAMNTMTDSSDSHLAQMVIQGMTMGTTELTRLVREHENTDCSEESLRLARAAVELEERTIEKMKKYL